MAVEGEAETESNAEAMELEADKVHGLSPSSPHSLSSLYTKEQATKRFKGNVPGKDDGKKAESMYLEDRNTPLKDERDPVVIVKAYHTDSFKINTLVEFFGVLGPADSTYSRPDFDEDDTALMGGIEEMRAHLPPPSLVPRLHSFYHRELGEAHPLKDSLSNTGVLLLSLICSPILLALIHIS